MRHRTHTFFGISLGMLVTGILSINIGYVVFSLLTSTLPDIDTTRGKIGRLFPGVSNKINNKYQHRGIIHSFTGLFITFINFIFATS